MAAMLRRTERPVYKWPSPTRLVRIGTWSVCGASGLATASVGLHPTAARTSDVVLSAALGVVAAAAGSVARTRWWLVLCGIAGVSTVGWAAVPAVVALVLALAFTRWRGLRGRRLAGAVVGALALQSLIRIEGGPFGWSAAVTAVAVGLTVLSGWQNARSGARRIVRWAGLTVAGVCCALAASFSLTVLQARSSVEVGIETANDGRAAASVGDTAQAAVLLAQAERLFADAHGGLGGWLARPARVLPLLGQQSRALELLTGAGREATASAAAAARDADVQSLTVQQGRLDLDRVAAMRAPIRSVATASRTAAAASEGAASGWLLPPVASRLARFTTAVGEARADAETAAEAIAVVPGLFGGEKPRRYFVAFTNPAETRSLGGFTGAYAEVVIDDGRMKLVRHGNIQQLNEVRAGLRRFLDPAVFPDRFRELLPEQFWQNVTGTADLPTVAQAVRQLWSQSGGGHLDGVMAVDPYALAALLELTGPLALEGLDEPLSAQNAARFLLRDQYLRFDVTAERVDFLAEAARTVFDALTTGDLPGARRVSEAVGPVVRSRRLVLHSFHPDEQDLFERLGADGSVPPADRSDFLSVRSSNRAPNKLDSMLERTLDYSVTVDPATGAARARLSVKLRNAAPPSGLPQYIVGNESGRPFGTNIMTLEVSSPLGIAEVTTGGRPEGVAVSTEYGRPVYSALVEVPPGAERVVTFTLEGTLDVSRGYSLTVLPQPVANPDRLVVAVAATGGWQALGTAAVAETVLAEDLQVRTTFRRS